MADWTVITAREIAEVSITVHMRVPGGDTEPHCTDYLHGAYILKILYIRNICSNKV